ncbi:XRE family transcriptional regulator [Streptomyces sp. H27-G5]|uniref:XRE family transcriptional regulator n=1 Tax=Streptomyces sp. H27-G5 TaxID=2996698 RepID=UPI00226D691F|nr:XRE family transcriptional regulator [Streptomyces sp. H27-G5]MCY0923096.1 XRE family transcriptional regulator [Streptomyces sp. H27-G5]
MTECTHPLAHQRASKSLTRVDLAKLICAAAKRRGLRSGTDKHRIRKWEVLGVTPEAETQIYIAEALELPLASVDPAAWPHWLPAGDGGVVPLGPSSTVIALREALNTAMERLERRTFLTISGTALTALAAAWATGPGSALAALEGGGKLVGEDTVTVLEDISRQLNSLATEQRQHVSALLDAHLATVTDLIDGSRYDKATGLRLHTLAASLAQTVAWHRFDHGRHTAASKLWVAGLHSAHATRDPDLGAAMLGDLAYQAAWRQDQTTAAGILRQALKRAQHPAARSLLHLRLARTLAAQKDKQPALRALEAAEHHFGASAGRPLPAWCSWMSEADLAVDSGQALLDLGDARRAHQLITEGQALLPGSRAKTRGVFLAYQAASHLQLKEPELAARAAEEALTLSRRIGAPRCEQLVQGLVPGFQPYRAAPGVPAFLALAVA